jgi:hypothetical protein
MKKAAVLAILSIFLLSFLVAAGGSEWWDSDWKNRSVINITERSGRELIDYQVLVIFNESNFDYSKALPNGEDLRFLDSGDSLSYWIETWDNTEGTGRIWVKVPRIPARGITTLYVYYDNSQAEEQSNSEKTFDLFDDFNKGVTSSWRMETNVGSNTQAQAHVSTDKKVFNSPPYSLETNFDKSPSGCVYGGGHTYAIRSFSVSTTGDYLLDFYALSRPCDICKIMAEAYIDKEKVFGEVIKDPPMLRRNVTRKLAEGIHQLSLGINTDIYCNGIFNAHFDDVIVRKYVDPEPYATIRLDDEEKPPEKKKQIRDDTPWYQVLGVAIAFSIVVLLLLAGVLLFAYRTLIYKKSNGAGIECKRCGMSLPSNTKKCPVCGSTI